MRRSVSAVPILLTLCLLPAQAQDCLALRAAARPMAARPNLVLFVPDGLRGRLVDAQRAPTMDALRRTGVAFPNAHSLFPTFTTPNASAFATGVHLGDTGDFGNTLLAGFGLQSAAGSPIPFIENNAVLAELDASARYAGDFLGEPTLLAAARCLGYATAAVGKLGPTLIQDHTLDGRQSTVVIDDATGMPAPAGVPLSPEVAARLKAQGLPTVTPKRGANGDAGDAERPGTLVDNRQQQDYFLAATTRVILPWFREQGRPFFLVYWSRDPDGSQHGHGDSPNALVPGINGPTSLAGVRDADNNLAGILQTLEDLGLAGQTDLIVASDHGFSTIAKESLTSASARVSYPDTKTVRPGQLPPGFLALDLARGLGLPLYDPDDANCVVSPDGHPRRGNALIGGTPEAPALAVAANGGSDLIYLARPDRRLVQSVLDVLLRQDYVSGLFVDDALGRFDGTLRLGDINLKGEARTPVPSILVNFRSFSTGCEDPLLCAVEVADTSLQQGQGMHGSFSRADTLNFIAARGPDFRAGFVDLAPVSNADVGLTLAWLLGLDTGRGTVPGRVLREAIDQPVPAFEQGWLRSAPAPGGLRTLLRFQRVDDTRYFDAAGFPGRTLGLMPAD